MLLQQRAINLLFHRYIETFQLFLPPLLHPKESSGQKLTQQSELKPTDWAKKYLFQLCTTRTRDLAAVLLP